MCLPGQYREWILSLGSERKTGPALDYFNAREHLEVYNRFQREFLAPGRRSYVELALVKAPYNPGCIIEIGCGQGEILELLSQRYPQARIVGVDPSEEMIKRSKQRLGDKATLIHGDVGSVFNDLPPADLIIGYSNFRFWKQPITELSHLVQTLRNKDALLYLADIRRDIDPSVFDAIMDRLGSDEFRALFSTQVKSAYTLEELGVLFEQADLPGISCMVGGLGGSDIMSREAFTLLQRHEHLSNAVFALKSNGFLVPQAADAIMHIYGNRADGQDGCSP